MKIYVLSFFVFLFSSCSLIQFGAYNPPTKNEALANSEYAWQKDSTEHFNFYSKGNYL